jgi:trehalose-phosphatase
VKTLLDKDWSRILGSGRRRGRLLLFLDFDGTLAPIVKHPGAAKLPGSVRRILNRLKSLCQIVIISGRGLQDVKSRVAMTGVIYVGNHGMQSSGFKLTASVRLQKALHQAQYLPILAQKLHKVLGVFADVIVEDKRLTISIHFRNLPPARRRAFNAVIHECREAHRLDPVIWRKGKKIWEIRPKLNWGKGDAVRMIKDRLPHTYTIVLGDDETDEDMFRVIGKSGLSIRIGRPRTSHASYCLKSPKEVETFLKALTGFLGAAK